MSKQEREILDQLRARSVEAAADVMAGVQRLKTLHDDFAGEDAESDRIQLGDYLFKLARLELEHVSNLLSLGNAQAEMMFEHVRRLARRARSGESPRKIVLLTAAHGESARARFEIRNPFGQEADPRFDLGAFRRQDGTAVEDVKARVVCGCVAAHTEAGVNVEVPTSSLQAGDVLFAELSVYLSADVEREVARRMLKLKVRGGDE